MLLEFICFYLDDGSVGGSMKDVRLVYDLILRDGPRYGLFVNEGKCEIVGEASSLENMDWGKDISKITNGNIDIVGVPIGSAEYIEEYFKEQFDDIEAFYKRLRLLNDPQLWLFSSFPTMLPFVRSIIL